MLMIEALHMKIAVSIRRKMFIIIGKGKKYGTSSLISIIFKAKTIKPFNTILFTTRRTFTTRYVSTNIIVMAFVNVFWFDM